MVMINDQLSFGLLTNNLTISLFIGNVFNLYLYGALTVQLYLYYISFPDDPRLFKIVIYVIYLIETVYTILLTYGWGRSLLVDHYLSIMSTISILVCGPAVALLTQCIYAYRVRVISKLKFLSWCIIVLIALGLVATVAATVAQYFTAGYFVPPLLIWSSVSLLTDLMIACTLAWSLRKNEISSRRLQQKVARLVYLIIGTGLLTVAVNIITIATSFIPTTDPIGPAIVLSKLYANSMMVFVNDRTSSNRSQDDHFGTSDMVTVHVGSLHFARATGTVAGTEEHIFTTFIVADDDMSSQAAVEVPAKRKRPTGEDMNNGQHVVTGQ